MRIIGGCVISCFAVVLPVSAQGSDSHGDALPAGAVARFGTVRLRHGDWVYCMAYAPDGNTLAAAGSDPVLRLWDPATGKQRRELAGHRKQVTSMAYSTDGKLLASGDESGIIRLWDMAAGKEIRSLSLDDRRVYSLAFVDGNKTLIGVGDWGHVRHWNTQTGKETRQVQIDASLDYACTVSQAPIERDGSAIYSVTDYRTIRRWSAQSGKLQMEYRGHTDVVRSLAVSPDGRTLASGAQDGTVRLWNARGGKLLHTLPCPERIVVILLFAPDGKTLASQDQHGAICLWDVERGKQLRRIDTGHFRALAFAPDGKTLAATEQAAIHLWNVDTGQERLTWPGHRAGVRRIAFSDDGKTLASGGDDGAVLLWDVAAPSKPRVLGDNIEWIHGIAFAPGRPVVAASGRKRILLWDAATGKLLRKRDTHYSDDGIAITFYPDGKTLLVGDRHHRMVRWDTDTDDKIHRLYDGIAIRDRAYAYPNVFALSPDGKTLVAGLFGRLTVYDGITGKEQFRLCDREPAFLHLLFAPDGRTLSAVNEDRSVSFWNVAMAQEYRQTAPLDAGYSAAYSPGGHYLALGHARGGVSLLETQTGQVCLHMRGQRGRIAAVAFSPDGRLLATASADASLLLWDLARLPDKHWPPAPMSATRLHQLWTDLGSKDAGAAYRAVVTFGAERGKATAFLIDQLRLLNRHDPVETRRLVRRLDDRSYAVRVQAHAELERLEDIAAPALHEALGDKPAVELHRRIDALLQRLNAVEMTARQLQVLRAIQALERAATPEAHRWFEQHARSAPRTRLGQEAQAALKRMALRP